jgi:hypothetical protein
MSHLKAQSVNKEQETTAFAFNCKAATKLEYSVPGSNHRSALDIAVIYIKSPDDESKEDISLQVAFCAYSTQEENGRADGHSLCFLYDR